MRNFSRSRRMALAGGAALVIGGAAVASVAAQQQIAIDGLALPPDSQLADRRQQWLKAVAAKLAVTPERLDQAIQDTAKEQGLPPPLVMPFPGLAINTPGTFSIRIDSGFGAAARALGLSDDQLRAESTNKTLADVARAHNVDPKVVSDALKAQRRADLDTAAADGKLPAQLADRLKAELDQEIDRLMNLPGLAAGNRILHLEHSVVTSPEP